MAPGGKGVFVGNGTPQTLTVWWGGSGSAEIALNTKLPQLEVEVVELVVVVVEVEVEVEVVELVVVVVEVEVEV